MDPLPLLPLIPVPSAIPAKGSIVTDDQDAFLGRLVEIIEERTAERRKAQSLGGWPVERWLTVVALLSILGGAVIASVIRWHDVDVIAASEQKLESRLDALSALDDSIYARKDLYDERMKAITDKLDTISVDVKAIKITTGRQP